MTEPPRTAVPLPPEREARILRAAARLAPAVAAASARAEALGELSPVVAFAQAPDPEPAA